VALAAARLLVGGEISSSPIVVHGMAPFGELLGCRAYLLKLGRKAQLLLPPGLEEIVALPAGPVNDFGVRSCHQGSGNWFVD